jgi:Tol biopolymer transport system component
LLYVRIREHSHHLPHRIESDIAVMGKNGHDVTVLTHTKRDEGSAAFSPNGKRIVFDRCCYGQSHSSEIFVMRADGTHVVRLTNNDVYDIDPDWQPIPTDL